MKEIMYYMQQVVRILRCLDYFHMIRFSYGTRPSMFS